MIELQGQIKSFSTAFIGIPKVYLNHIWYPIDAAIRAQSRSIPAWNEYIYFWKSTTTIIFYFLLVFFFFFFSTLPEWSRQTELFWLKFDWAMVFIEALVKLSGRYLGETVGDAM